MKVLHLSRFKKETDCFGFGFGFADAYHGWISCNGANTEGRNGEWMVKSANFRINSSCNPWLPRHLLNTWNGWISREAFRHPTAIENHRAYLAWGEAKYVE